MPKIGSSYTRLYGNKDIVEVKSISADGWIKIKDRDCIHFVSTETFEKYFREIKK